MSTLGKCRKIDPKFQRTAEGACCFTALFLAFPDLGEQDDSRSNEVGQVLYRPDVAGQKQMTVAEMREEPLGRRLQRKIRPLRKDNVNQWVDGFGDLPENLVRFALTLPWWQAPEHGFPSRRLVFGLSPH